MTRPPVGQALLTGDSDLVSPREQRPCHELAGRLMTTPGPLPATPSTNALASPYSSGGGGTVLEHRYGVLLLSHLLSGDPVPELGSDVSLTRVVFQARAESDVDDYMLVGLGGDDTERRASVAVRRAPRLIPSDARSIALLATFLATLLNDWDAVRAGRSRLVLASTRSLRARSSWRSRSAARNSSVESSCSRASAGSIPSESAVRSSVTRSGPRSENAVIRRIHRAGARPIAYPAQARPQRVGWRPTTIPNSVDGPGSTRLRGFSAPPNPGYNLSISADADIALQLRFELAFKLQACPLGPLL